MTSSTRVYDCKAGLYLRRIRIALKSRLMLAPPICDLRDRGVRAIPFLMNSHGITIESISIGRIRYTIVISSEFLFPGRASIFPPRSRDASFDAFIPRFFRLPGEKFKKYECYIGENLIYGAKQKIIKSLLKYKCSKPSEVRDKTAHL